MIEIVCISPEMWKQHFADNAHRIAFDKRLSPEKERIDFALLAVKDGCPGGYMTCRELNADRVYLQFGGVFPPHKGTVHVFSGYLQLIDWVSDRYKVLETCIENTNKVMLKMAMKAGFLIIGIRHYNGVTLLIHKRENDTPVHRA